MKLLRKLSPGTDKIKLKITEFWVLNDNAPFTYLYKPEYKPMAKSRSS